MPSGPPGSCTPSPATRLMGQMGKASLALHAPTVWLVLPNRPLARDRHGCVTRHSDHCSVEEGLPRTRVLLWVAGEQLRAVFDTVVLVEYRCRDDWRERHVQEIRDGVFYPTRVASRQGRLHPVDAPGLPGRLSREVQQASHVARSPSTAVAPRRSRGRGIRSASMRTGVKDPVTRAGHNLLSNVARSRPRGSYQGTKPAPSESFWTSTSRRTKMSGPDHTSIRFLCKLHDFSSLWCGSNQKGY